MEQTFFFRLKEQQSMLNNPKIMALSQGAAAFDCTESATDQQNGGATSPMSSRCLLGIMTLRQSGQ